LIMVFTVERAKGRRWCKACDDPIEKGTRHIRYQAASGTFLDNYHTECFRREAERILAEAGS